MNRLILAILVYIVSITASYANSNNNNEIDCLAKNIYFEARNQSFIAQKAVAFVTLNRVEDDKYPDDICSVVWQDKQFSWTHDGKSDIPKNLEAWAVAIIAAQEVIRNYGSIHDPTRGAVMYHTVRARPYWRNYYTVTVIIEDHIFYKE